jgi:nucleotide-binding universal stress UspA family protein
MRVLIAVDLNAPYHEWVVERARPLVRLLGAKVDACYIGEDSPEHRRRLQIVLDLFDEGQRGGLVLQEGPASHVLVGLSDRYEVLLLGPREPSAIDRVLRGSVVARVLPATRCPVLIPRKPLHSEGRWRLLVGVDVAGKHREEVVRAAGEWARRLNGVLDAVYASSDPLPMLGDAKLRALAHKEWEAAREPEREQVRQLLASLVDPAVQGEARVAHGEPEDVVEALSPQYDLVVVGNRTREGLMRFFYGRVSSNLVRLAQCDVLVLPTATLA